MLGCEHTLPASRKECASFRAAPSSAGEDTKVRDMFDEKSLEGMTFGELNDALEYVLDRLDQIQDERTKGEDDPRLDMLIVMANKIIMEMDAIMREQSHAYPEALAQWNKVAEGYKEHFAKYADTYLKEDPLLNLPETS
jgi:hypothetical protein